ncbi:MAG TPA: glycosyltransferase [Steroidobacteraceae bacterium]|nr:glycosyltransferase [Steroidobacteraceae bacterium]
MSARPRGRGGGLTAGGRPAPAGDPAHARAAAITAVAGAPQLSVIIPVYDEEQVLPKLFQRLYPALDALGRTYEIVFVNDGSRDRSAALLRAQFEQRPDVTRVVLFAGNFGQHRAILAGFAHARGRYVVTLDADLQNPPEEIERIVAQMDAGHDYVGTIRRQRQDAVWRRWASRLMNTLRERITHVRITDQGCMFRGYARGVVEAVNQCSEYNTFVPALAYTFAVSPVEILVGHEERGGGRSKYSMLRLLRLNFDLMTGFSSVPVQLFSVFGICVSLLSGVLFVLLMVRRLLLGAEVQGVFTLFALAFMFIGTALFGIGLVGEYVGRIYDEVRRRPRYIVGAVMERTAAPAPSAEPAEPAGPAEPAAPAPPAAAPEQLPLPAVTYATSRPERGS